MNVKGHDDVLFPLGGTGQEIVQDGPIKGIVPRHDFGELLHVVRRWSNNGIIDREVNKECDSAKQRIDDFPKHIEWNMISISRPIVNQSMLFIITYADVEKLERIGYDIVAQRWRRPPTPADQSLERIAHTGHNVACR
jgi:hypothetical protein